jgi:hypothetical protein
MAKQGQAAVRRLPAHSSARRPDRRRTPHPCALLIMGTGMLTSMQTVATTRTPLPAHPGALIAMARRSRAASRISAIIDASAALAASSAT